MKVFGYKEECGCEIGWFLGWDEEEKDPKFCLTLQRFVDNACKLKWHQEADDEMALNIYLTKEELKEGINRIIEQAELEIRK